MVAIVRAPSARKLTAALRLYCPRYSGPCLQIVGAPGVVAATMFTGTAIGCRSRKKTAEITPRLAVCPILAPYESRSVVK